MKALSLMQPYASLLCMGIKTVETRSWPTTHRGLLYIHASKTYSPEGMNLWSSPPIVERLQKRFDMSKVESGEDIPWPTFEALPRGAVIGWVTLDNCLLMTQPLIDRQTGLEILCGDWKVGRFAWLTSVHMELKEPIPSKGSLQLWDFDPNAPPPQPKPSQAQLFAIRKSVAKRRRKQKGIVVEQDVFLENDPILDRIQRKFAL